MIVVTTTGAINDLREALRLFLARFHGEAMANEMVGELSFSHCSEEDAILGHAIGREPAATVLREICLLVGLHAEGIIRTHAASYQFKLMEQADQSAFDRMLSHYLWLDSLKRRMGPPSMSR